MPLRLRFLAPFCLLLPVLLGGCTGADGEDEHLEHAIPDHKPHNFAEAVDEIRERSREPLTDRNSPSYRELTEIVGWVPELAADSDMAEPEWKTARQASETIHGMLTDPATEGSPISLESLDPQIEVLAGLVEAAGPPEPEPPEHDHHHHGDDDHHEEGEDKHDSHHSEPHEKSQ